MRAMDDVFPRASAAMHTIPRADIPRGRIPARVAFNRQYLVLSSFYTCTRGGRADTRIHPRRGRSAATVVVSVDHYGP